MKDYPALIPNWEPEHKRRPFCGSGVARRYFAVAPDGHHGESKRGWGPNVSRSPKDVLKKGGHRG